MAQRHQVEPARNAQPGAILLVIHEFVARSPDELSLAKGDRIELIERDDDFGDGWYLGRHLQNGNTGLFPEVYTTSAPKGTLSSAQNSRFRAPKNAGSPIATSVDNSEKRSGGIVSPQQLAASPNPNQDSPRVTSAEDVNNSRQVYSGKYIPPSHIAASITTSPTAITSQPPAASKAQSPTTNSTVMNETLSVIDEHITDMRKPGPGTGRSPGLRRAGFDSPSEYSAMTSETRLSYIQGSETEEEESGVHTEKEVKDWSPARVAEYLEEVGVEKRHCEVFREQEFSGDVVLGMDQSSIFLKELDLGPIGRRLKTWQKIRALQDEVLPPKPSQTRKVSEHSQSSSRRASQGSLSMIQRSSQVPERPLVHGSDIVDGLGNQLQAQVSSGRNEAISTPGVGSASPRPTMMNTHSSRPSAASVRSLGHSRRHSSMDQASNSSAAPPPQKEHVKKPSLDQGWNMASAAGQTPEASQANSITTQTKTTPQPNTNARPVSSAHVHAASSDRTPFEKRTSQIVPSPAIDSDRGYVSSNEADGGKGRRVLRKREGAEHNRASSYESGKRMSFFRRASRASSPAPGRSRDISAPVSMIQTDSGTTTLLDKNDSPSVTASEQSSTPVVTNLEQMDNESKRESTLVAASTTSDPPPSPSRKGLRATSDAVTGREKALHSMWAENVSPTDPVPQSPSSGTPSGASRSIEIDDANKSQYATPLGMPPSSGTKRKSKKKTSAYLRGLEHKSPQEQMLGCDHSGWMKKKSSNLMTNWKPRLFVLRGRRLSYYYSEDDTEEKGLIDISGHRVLPADNERLTGLHATITKATSNPTSPQIARSSTFSSTASASPITPAESDGGGGIETLASTPSTMAGSSVPNTPKEGTTTTTTGQGFIFKLVPPRVGLSKAVNFTKPTVHYFAVPSVEVGRLWMAALMKATIDRDESVEVVTTYQQKTVSLAKARARKERPPALKGLEEEAGGGGGGGDTQTLGGTSEGDSSQLQKVEEDGDAENEEEEDDARRTNTMVRRDPTASAAAEKEETNAKPETPVDQMREVTDLSPVISRTSMSPTQAQQQQQQQQHQRQRSGSKRSGSGEGLGIQGLSNGGSGTPLLTQMKSAGLW